MSEIEKFVEGEYAGPRRGFGGKHTTSGPGSEGAFGKAKTHFVLDTIFRRRTLTALDIGCGDCWWMKDIVHQFDRYHGVDVSADLVEQNRERYGTDQITFQHLDMADLTGHVPTGDLPVSNVDLVLCLDVFLHLKKNEIEALLINLRFNFPQWHYLMITNERGAREPSEKTRWQRIDISAFAPVFFNKDLRLVKAEQLTGNTYLELYERL